jgi:hypothetical protein
VQLLTDVEHATQVELDRWEVQCIVESTGKDEEKSKVERYEEAENESRRND